MKAWVLHDVNDFKLEEKDMPTIDDTQVLVHVKATGICGSDIPRAFTTGAHKKDLVIGHEFAGEIAAVAENDDQSMVGKRMGIFPLIPCRECGPCKNKQFEMCRNYNYLGSRCDGGFAEYVAVPKANLIELPENVSFEQAAMLEPMAVAVHAMRRGLGLMNINDAECGEAAASVSDKSVAVCGLGTIGLLLVMFLKQKGFKNIYVIGNKASQMKHIATLGICEEYYFDGRNGNAIEWINEKTGGVDLYFECVGKNETISDAIDSVKPAGAIVLVGNPFSDVELNKATYWKILRNQIKVTGTWNSSFTGDEQDDWHYVIDCLKNGTIAPEKLISHRYGIEDIYEGFEIMRDKKEDYVKIMYVDASN